MSHQNGTVQVKATNGRNAAEIARQMGVDPCRVTRRSDGSFNVDYSGRTSSVPEWRKPEYLRVYPYTCR